MRDSLSCLPLSASQQKYERKAFLENHVFSIVKMPSKGDGIVIPMMVL